MAVPSSVRERLDRLEKVRKRINERKGADRAEQERRQAVNADRNARRQLLMELAKDVFDWRDVIVKSRDGERLWSLIGAGTRIFLFQDWYWDGLPFPADNQPGARTCVFLDGPHHHFLVEEWRNGPGGALESHREVCRIKSQIEMVDLLHPLMLETLQTHLSGPEAWQSILDELDLRLARYGNAG
jgi:hypothetical protein